MTNFEKWVEKMNTYFGEDYLNGSCDVEWLFDGKVTICYDITNNKIGIAKCHPDDENDFHIGKAIAYARCKGYEIPKQKVYKTLSEMKNGDMFYGITGCRCTFIGENKKIDSYIIWNEEEYFEMRNGVKYRMVD